MIIHYASGSNQATRSLNCKQQKIGKPTIINTTNQSSDILQHSQNRPTGDRWLKFYNTTIQIIKQNCKLDISK